MSLFIQHKTSEKNPENSGYYPTDRGELFYHKAVEHWYMNESVYSGLGYPFFYYEPIPQQ